MCARVCEMRLGGGKGVDSKKKRMKILDQSHFFQL